MKNPKINFEERGRYHRRQLFLYSLGIQIPEQYAYIYSSIMEMFDVYKEETVFDGRVDVTYSLKENGDIIYTRNLDIYTAQYRSNTNKKKRTVLIFNHIYWELVCCSIKDKYNFFPRLELNILPDLILKYKKVDYDFSYAGAVVYFQHAKAILNGIKGE